MKCNFAATSFVKKTLKRAHATLVDRLVEKAHIREMEIHNSRLEERKSILSSYSDPKSPAMATSLPSPDPTQQGTHTAPPYSSSSSAYQDSEHRGSIGRAPYPYSPPLESMQHPPQNSRYSQPPPDPRYSQPPADPRLSPTTHGPEILAAAWPRPRCEALVQVVPNTADGATAFRTKDSRTRLILSTEIATKLVFET